MSFTQMLANLGEWACNRLAPYKAAHAGKIDTQDLSGFNRKFGIILDIGTPDASTEPSVLTSALDQCGAKPPFVETMPRFEDNPVKIRDQIVKMKTLNVTTVFCLCISATLVKFQAVATGQDYQPEWVISNYPQLGQGEGYEGEQIDRTFGVSFQPMDRVREDHPRPGPSARATRPTPTRSRRRTSPTPTPTATTPG